MATFRGEVQGNRGAASRLGNKHSGLYTSANSWTAGVDVRAYVDENGLECFDIYQTGGSNGGGMKLLARIVNGRATAGPEGGLTL